MSDSERVAQEGDVLCAFHDSTLPICNSTSAD
jgi:hypothetical protein